MEFNNFLKETLDIPDSFDIIEVRKFEHPDKVIEIHLQYSHKYFDKDGIKHKLYDKMPQRRWQHLSWFEYKCYLTCELPRYIDEQGKVKVIDTSFGSKNKEYTHLFARYIIKALQIIRVQKTVADLFQISA